MVSVLLWITLPTWLAIAWRKCYAMIRPVAKHAAMPKSIVVYRLDQLGDLVLTTPLLRELKRLHPGARCTVVVRPQHKAILTTNRNVDEILALHEIRAQWLPSRGQWLASVLWFYWTELRHHQFDLAISPRWDVDECLATMLSVLTKAQRRVGYTAQSSLAKRTLNRGFDAAFDVVVPAGSLQHEVDRNLAVAEALGATVENRQLEIRLTERDRNFAGELLKYHDKRSALVALGIGGRSEGRRWPLERYAECIAHLSQHRKIQPVIVCSAEEDADASALSVQLLVPPYIVSGLPLRAVCAVLQRCDLFLCNDTGTAHLSAAMNCPTVVVSRHPVTGDPAHANSPVRFAPRCSPYRVVQPLSAAGDCAASCQQTAPHCILQVTVDQVAQAAMELLPRPQPQRLTANASARLVEPSSAASVLVTV